MDYSSNVEQAPDNSGQSSIPSTEAAAGQTTSFVDYNPYLTLMPAVGAVVSTSFDQHQQHPNSNQQQVSFDHAPTGAGLNSNFVFINTGFNYGSNLACPPDQFLTMEATPKRRKRSSVPVSQQDSSMSKDNGFYNNGINNTDSSDDQLNKKPTDPFAPECSIPLPFQLNDESGSFGHQSVWKRNERERHRVRCVNDGYEKLRSHLPFFDRDKRLSKVETLRLAVRYIKHLTHMLHDELHYLNCHCELDKHLTLSNSDRGSADLDVYSPDSSPLGSDAGCFEQQQRQQRQKSAPRPVNNENDNTKYRCNEKYKRNKRPTAATLVQ